MQAVEAFTKGDEREGHRQRDTAERFMVRARMRNRNVRRDSPLADAPEANLRVIEHTGRWETRMRDMITDHGASKRVADRILNTA